jgi:2'-5' RNA ligase
MPRLFTALEIPRDAALSLSLLQRRPARRALDRCRELPHHPALHRRHRRPCRRRDRRSARPCATGRAFQLTLAGVGAFGRQEAARGLGRRPSLRPTSTRCRPRSSASASASACPSDPRKFIPARHAGAAQEFQPGSTSHTTCQRAAIFRHRALQVSAASCLMSSRDSVGGGPYVVEEAWPLNGVDARAASRSASASEASRIMR